jgi:hypothetical protein
MKSRLDLLKSIARLFFTGRQPAAPEETPEEAALRDYERQLANGWIELSFTTHQELCAAAERSRGQATQPPPCTVCNGKGFLNPDGSSPFGTNDWTNARTCPACNGKGFFEASTMLGPPPGLFSDSVSDCEQNLAARKRKRRRRRAKKGGKP